MNIEYFIKEIEKLPTKVVEREEIIQLLNDKREFLSIKEAAEYLGGLTRQRLYQFVWDGKLTKYKRLGKPMFKITELDALLIPKKVK